MRAGGAPIDSRSIRALHHGILSGYSSARSGLYVLACQIGAEYLGLVVYVEQIHIKPSNISTSPQLL
jgi:hypothetical protein